MIPAFSFQPQGRKGPTGIALCLDPASGSVIKDEPEAVVWRQLLPDGTPAVVKVYPGRKLVWFKQRGWYNGRAEREYLALHQAEQHQVPCSPPLFWAAGRTPEGMSYELLATREVPNVTDMKEWLKIHRDDHNIDLKPLFTMIAQLHRAGIMHGALLARNILVAGDDYYVIDLPRSQRFGGSVEGRFPGMFDVELLLANLVRHLTDETLVSGLAGYPLLPVSPGKLVAAVRKNPMGKYKRILLRDFFLIQSAWSRLF